jgi:hypothetical protein
MSREGLNQKKYIDFEESEILYIQNNRASSCVHYFHQTYQHMKHTNKLKAVSNISNYGVVHGGIWRTMHCRLCINCYGTGFGGRGRGV